MLLKIRVKARGRYVGRVTESCRDILIKADVRADRYSGSSEEFEDTSGGEDKRESIIVGRFARTDGLAAEVSAGGGDNRCESSE